MMRSLLAAGVGWLLPFAVPAADVGNRLTYLDEYANPYYVGLQTPKLITPQWVGEEGVEAVVVLSIDDMADAARYEAFLRPILERLKQIDGRAPLSIMTKSIDPQLPQLQQWLAEGVSLEVHTIDHPCPCLQGGKLEKAKDTYDRCVDLLSRVANTRPLAFRMPCCDSMNSVSPRFFTEIFGQTTPGGRFLTMDSSVFMLFTANDPALPRALIFDQDGRERFRKYLPTERGMANYVEDYPYPYVIDRLCWEVPCVMPSDWDAQNRNGKCSPLTVADLKFAVDATVLKQGMFALCFHPHGWINNTQIVELIEHAVSRYGRKVKFLSLRDVQERLDKHLLAGQPLRDRQGRDNGVRLCDVNHDGYLDVVIGNPSVRQTRVWSPGPRQWQTTPFPVELVRAGPPGAWRETGVRFGVLQPNGHASILVRNQEFEGVWHFETQDWIPEPAGLRFAAGDNPVTTSAAGRDRGVRLRDLDLDGICELIVGQPQLQAVYAHRSGGWQALPFRLPEGATIVDDQGRDAGLRFVDFDEDGRADVVFSNAQRYAACAFTSMTAGWSRTMLAGERRGEPRELPPIVRADGTNNGAWFNYRHMWVQNEETGGTQPQQVEIRSFTHDLLALGQLGARGPRRQRRDESLAPDSPSRGPQRSRFAISPGRRRVGPDDGVAPVRPQP